MLIKIIILLLLIYLNNVISISPDRRINCDPELLITKSDCLNRGCVWDDDEIIPFYPQCYFPSNTGYIIQQNYNEDDKSIDLIKSSSSVKNPYGDDFKNLNFQWEELGSAVYIKIAPKNVQRYRPPVPINDTAVINSNEKLLVKSKNDSIFSFQVYRKTDNEKLFDTSLGGLLFADQYIQISALLSTKQIFGFGENVHKTLMHNLNEYKTWGMFSRDAGPDSVTDITKNYYGVHPFYMGLDEKSKKAHGVFIFNSNAQEVTLGPAPHLTYRTIGGQLELFFFPGPTPEKVIQQYQQIIGRPYLPPYWSLGFQICRWGYTGTEEIMGVVNRTRAAGIPQDVQFSDIDYMNRYEDFTYNKNDPNWTNLPTVIDTLHNDYGMHFTLIFDPGVEADYLSFKRGRDANAAFIEWPRFDLVPQNVEDSYPMVKGTKIMLGKVWPENNAAFPDFLDPTDVTQKWWEKELEGFVNLTHVDGAWIDMNEPSNFDTKAALTKNFVKDEIVGYVHCPVNGEDSKYDMPPYQTVNVFHWGNYIFTKTLCMFASTMRNETIFYNTKNLYGWSEMRATMIGMEKARNKRACVISRSTYASSGKYGGHWLGDNTSRWPDLQTTIIGVQEFNMFGIPYVGSDICGFNGVTNEELCLRWHQLGAFHSFNRNHNAQYMPPQDPTQWISVANAAKKANLFRYRHLPYLYTLHFEASLSGGTVIRPVFFEFPKDSMTVKLSHQFMWGDSLMIIPVIEPNVTSVYGYLPSSSIWYSIYDVYYGSLVQSGNVSRVASTTTLIPVFVRGGKIIPRQSPGLTTKYSRNNRFELLIALNQLNTESTTSAYGNLYWDDGESLFDKIENHNYYHFTFNATLTTKDFTLIINKQKSAENLILPNLENIEIFGYQFSPNLNNITVNGNHVNINDPNDSWSPFNQIANITSGDLINFNNDSTWTIYWTNS